MRHTAENLFFGHKTPSCHIFSIASKLKPQFKSVYRGGFEDQPPYPIEAEFYLIGRIF